MRRETTESSRTARVLATVAAARSGARAHLVRGGHEADARRSVRVTRDIAPDRMRDLLERAPRACICFASDRGPEAWPVVLVAQNGRYVAGVSESAERLPAPGDEVVLLVDDGVRFFDLCAVSIRGPAMSCAAPAGGPTSHAWFEVTPVRTGGWDFGALREVSDET